MADVDTQTFPEPEGFPKADVVHRFIAKFVDFLIVAALAKLIPPVGFFTGMAYLLIGDGFFEGQSVGKRLIGLRTLRRDRRGGNPAIAFRESILRNVPCAMAYLCWIIPFIGWLLAFGVLAFEALLVIGNLQGLRLGDEIARTQVIEVSALTERARPEPSVNP